jgi:hypothetical protein
MPCIRGVGLLVLAACLFASAHAQEKKDQRPEPEKKPQVALLKAVRELGVPSFTNKVTVYYNTGHEKRAKEFSSLIAEAMRFYEQKLKIKAELSVAVLAKADWERVAQGIEKGVMALRGKASPATLRKIEQCGFTFEQGAEKLIDLIGLHELGHVLTLAYGIHPPSRWSNEFLANYFAYAYLREAHPKLATLFTAMSYDLHYTDADKPKYTSLDDFERLYLKVGPANYSWYQSAFVGRVEQVYEAQRFSFLEAVRDAYPTETKEPEPARAVLERLEQICPGFVAWGQGLK